MKKLGTLTLLLMCLIHWRESVSLIASNATVVTGNVTFICVFFRERNLAIDDFEMPEILTFCSCVVVHKLWVLTARQCYVQLDWSVSVVTEPFTNLLPAHVHVIDELHDMDELTMVKVKPDFKVSPVEISQKLLNSEEGCKMYGFSPSKTPVTGNKFNMLYKVWHMEGELLEVNVKITSYEMCSRKYPGGLSEYKSNFTLSTLCVDAIDDEFVEPCSFDRGAPIICNGKLKGILVYQRPLPKDVPLHLPTGCYGHFRKISLYAELMTPVYNLWMSTCVQKQNTSLFNNLIHKIMVAS